MKFTYDSYINMINMLKKHNYTICNYDNYKQYDKCAILRHDVDESLDYAYKLARLEYEININSTYYIFISSDLYNIFSKKSNRIIKEIESMGHKIGLHFDEVKYQINNEEELKKYVKKEASIMSTELNIDINSVSMHRPSKWVFEGDIKIEGLINSYSKEFIQEFKYVSDSRLNWRENITEIISSNDYKRLHILTHAFGYKDLELNPKDIYLQFLRDKKEEIYEVLDENTKKLDEFINKDDFLRS